MAIWPSTLPQQPLADSLQGSPQETKVRSETSWGVPIQRNKFSAFYEKFSLRMLMTLDELNILRDFYTNTLKNGSEVFTWKHPLTEEVKNCRFYSFYEYQHLSAMYFNVTLPIEFLP